MSEFEGVTITYGDVNRWLGIGDDELAELSYGASERHDKMVLPIEVRERAGRLASEISRELRRRDREKPNYRGRGRYRHVEGPIYEVLGRVGDVDEGDIVLRRAMIGTLYVEKHHEFEFRSSTGKRRYQYLGPLDELRPNCREVVERALDGLNEELAAGESPLGSIERMRERLLGSS